MFEELKPQETALIGMWLDLGGKVTGDAITDRICWLTEKKLELLAIAPAELSGLYRDPRDGRLWERRHPFEGGPPALLITTRDDAEKKYGPIP